MHMVNSTHTGMPNGYYAERDGAEFKVVLHRGPKKYTVFRILHGTHTEDDKKVTYNRIFVDWPHTEEFETWASDIGNALAEFTKGNDINLNHEHMYVSIYAAENTAALGSVMHMFTGKSTSPWVITIDTEAHVEKIKIPGAAIAPFLYADNRTVLLTSSVGTLQRISASVTDMSRYPRYIQLPWMHGSDGTAEIIMNEMPSSMFSPFSNTKLVTFNSNGRSHISTAALMQYMRARQQHQRDREHAHVLKRAHIRGAKHTDHYHQRDEEYAHVQKWANIHKAKHVPLPLDLTTVTKPDKKSLWVPRVVEYPGRDQSKWEYYTGGNIGIDGRIMPYTFPVIGMALSTILHMMSENVDQFDGRDVHCIATYRFEEEDDQDNSEEYDQQNWAERDREILKHLIADCKSGLGFTRDPSEADIVPTIGRDNTVSMGKRWTDPDGVIHEQELQFRTDWENMTTVGVICAIIRPPRHQRAGVTVNTRGPVKMDARIHCARCMKPVLLEYH